MNRPRRNAIQRMRLLSRARFALRTVCMLAIFALSAEAGCPCGSCGSGNAPFRVSDHLIIGGGPLGGNHLSGNHQAVSHASEVGIPESLHLSNLSAPIPMTSASPFYPPSNAGAQNIVFENSDAAYWEHGNEAACNEPAPCLEQMPGSSTYWQDDYASGYRHNEPLCHDSRRASFYASLESLALWRNELGATNAVPLLSNTFGLSGLNRFETEFDHSVRGTLGVAVGEWYRLEFAWLQEMEWSDRLSVDSDTSSELAEFHSSLRSSEINLRRRVRVRDWPRHYPDYWNGFEFSTLLGYRRLKLNESVGYELIAPASSDLATMTTKNKMSGVQLGCLAQWLYEDRGWLDFEAKGAILSNDLSATWTPETSRASESRTAFLIDSSIVCNYQFGSSLTLRLGYNMMWVTGVALASDNVAANPGLTVSNPRHDGDVLYHGPSIGLMYTK